MKKAALSLLLALIVSISLPATVSYAQEEFHVRVSPSKLELTADPGASSEFDITVENFTEKSHALDVYFMDYYVKPDNTVVYEEPGHFSYSCATWLSTETPELTLPGRGTAETSSATKTFGLHVPPEAEPGGHYGAIIFQQAAPEEAEEPVKVSARIAAMVLITVPGEIVRDGVIKSVSATSNWLWPTRRLPVFPRSPTRYSVVFENKGNVHLTIMGKLTYRPSFGWGVGTIDLPETTVLPGTTRNFKGEIPKPPLFGSYKLKAEISYGPSLFEFDTTKTMSCGFNSYPILAILLVLVLLGVIAATVVFIKRKRGKKAPGKEEVEKEEPEERSWTSFSTIWEEKPEEEPEEEQEEEKEEAGGEEVSEGEEVEEEVLPEEDEKDSGDAGEREDNGDEGQKEPGEKEKLHKRGSGKLNLRRLFKRGRKE